MDIDLIAKLKDTDAFMEAYRPGDEERVRRQVAVVLLVIELRPRVRGVKNCNASCQADSGMDGLSEIGTKKVVSTI